MEFWRRTPRQISRAIEGKTEQLRRQHNEQAWHTWHTAMLARASKHVPLSKLQQRDRRRRPRQSQQQMYAAVEAWVHVLGGTVEKTAKRPGPVDG